MKAIVLGESETDEAAIRILVEAILRRPVDWATATRRSAARGYSEVRKALPVTIRHAHYYMPEVELLVATVDSDDAPIQAPAHDAQPDAGCRLCGLREIVLRVKESLRPGPERARPLTVAVGVATPALEAWLLFGTRGDASEAAWRGRPPNTMGAEVRREFKRRKYGSETAPEADRLAKCEVNARRVAEDLDGLERAFPAGLAPLIKSVRSLSGAQDVT